MTATEGGTPVGNAMVLVNGVQVGVPGTPFTHTFTSRTIRVLDPETHIWYDEVEYDEIEVRADPQVYYEEFVNCDYFTPRLTAEIVSQSVPATLTPGQTASVAVTVKNTGNVTWTPAEGYRLGSQSSQDNTTWGINRVNLPGPVAPGAQVTLNFSVTAPATPGIYDFQWQMLLEGVKWFGLKTPVVKVTVGAVAARAAEFISKSVAVSMRTGKPLPTTWQIIMKNTGSETWTTAAGYTLGSQNPVDNTNWTKNRIPLPNWVASGQQVTFKFTGCYAPDEGVYVFQWRMLKEGVEWFGPATPAIQVRVLL